MASYTIETDQGLETFIQLFIVAVQMGKRFKTVNYNESSKDLITSFYDYNFHTNHEDINILTSGDNWKVTFEDDNYTLPPNVVVPNLSQGDPIFGPLSSGRIGGSSLGAFLMAAQHLIASAGQSDFTNTLPNKTQVPLMVSKILSIARNFTEFTSGLSQFIEIPTQIATGDFEFEQELSVTSAHAFVLVGNADNSSWFRVNSNGSLQVRSPVASTVSPSGVFLFDGILHKHRIQRIGSVFTWHIDELLVHTFSGVYTGDMAFNRIGQKANTNYLNGVPIGVNFISGFTNNGQPSNPLYPLDDTLLASDGVTRSTVIRNSRAVLGPELVSNTFPLNSEDIGGPSLTTYATGVSITAGVDYIVSVTISNYVGINTVGVSFSGGSNIPPTRQISNNGIIEFSFTAGSSFGLTLFSRSTNQCTFSNPSVRQADDYGTAVNLTAADTEKFTEQANGDLLGSLNRFDTIFNAFGTNGNNTVTNLSESTGTLVGDGASFFGMSTSIGSVGEAFRVTGTAIVTTGEGKLQAGTNANFGVVSNSGSFVFDAVLESTTFQIARNIGGVQIHIDFTDLASHRLIQRAT